VRTDRNGLLEGRGSIPGLAGRFRVRISGAHALRLISRAGKEGIYETEKITCKASDAAEYVELFGSFTRDRHARHI